MATIAAVNSVGESIVAMLRARRDLLAAEGRLGPVPAALAITHLSLAQLATAPSPPSAGLTLSCTRIAMSDHPRPRTRPGDASIAVELHYLVAAWSPAPAEEQAILSWSMLELAAHPVLDRSVLVGSGIWGRDETVQVVPETATDDALFRLWAALQAKYRLCTTFRARVIRIEHDATPDWPAVVATRFGFADTDVLADAGPG
ncbi:MAG: DUF4255 domain-containing protein [Acetobacteraceae bacterium]|nr:DUF4255 domain-containing protein [Acetobacteraceae bacterium]